MRKRTKLRKKVHTNPSISCKIMSIEQSICESHSKEKLYDETLTVTRIKTDSNFFFRYAKKLCTCTQAIGPIEVNVLSITNSRYFPFSTKESSDCPYF